MLQKKELKKPNQWVRKMYFLIGSEEVTGTFLHRVCEKPINVHASELEL